MSMIGGLPPPRPDQQYRPPGPPSPIGAAAGVLRARKVIIVGPNGGMFVYSPTQAPGNLVETVGITARGTDSSGNAYLEGSTTYLNISGTFYAVQQVGRGFAFLTAPGPGGPYTTTAEFRLGTAAGMLDLLANQFLMTLGSSGLNLIMASGDVTGVTDTAALATAVSSGFLPWLLPGTYSLNCANATLASMGPGQYIRTSGENKTIIKAVGAGDLFGWQQTGAYNGFTTVGGGIVGGCTIDGGATTNAADSIGIHAGDIESLIFEATVQNFNVTPGSWNILFDNRNHFTERLQGVISAKNGSNNVGFTVSGVSVVTSTKSFARPGLRIKITQGSNPNADGVAVLNGAQLYGVPGISIEGNFASSASPLTSAVLRVSGTVPAGHPGAGTASVVTCPLSIGVECDNTNANRPATIVYGASANNIKSNGRMDFGNNFAASSLAGGTIIYDGLIDGDATLGSRFYYGEDAAQSLTANGQTLRASGVAAVHPVSATAAVTGIILSTGAFGGQVIWLVNTGANSITFAASPGSNLAAGAATVLGAGASFHLVWDAGSALWYTA